MVNYSLIVEELESILNTFADEHYSEDDVLRLPYLYDELKLDSHRNLQNTKFFRYVEDCYEGNKKCDYLDTETKDFIDGFINDSKSAELILDEMFEYSDIWLIDLLDDIRDFKNNRTNSVRDENICKLLNLVKCLEQF